jgi:hypothetical protein
MAGKGANAARKNIEKARRAATSKRTIAHLPEEVRRDLGRQGAKERSIHGRSKMGKWELIDAIRGLR